MGTTTFVWDPVSDGVLMELDETDNVKAVYTNEARQYGGVLSQRRGNTSHYHHHDALGSTRFLTDSSGNVTDTKDKLAFIRWHYDNPLRKTVFRVLNLVWDCCEVGCPVCKSTDGVTMSQHEVF